MKPILFVVSDVRWQEQVDLITAEIPNPVTVWNLHEIKRGIWDVRKWLAFRRVLAAHADGIIWVLGESAQRAIRWAGWRINLQHLNTDVTWPWVIPATPNVVDREAILRRYDVPSNAFVFATSLAFEQKKETLPPIWGFEIIRFAKPDIYLLIHGTGPRRLELEEFANQLAPEGTRVRFVNDDMSRAELFQLADTVIGINQESLMAAIALEKPVVVSQLLASFFPGVEQDRMFNPTEPPSIAKKMLFSVDDPSFQDASKTLGISIREQHLPKQAISKIVTN